MSFRSSDVEFVLNLAVGTMTRMTEAFVVFQDMTGRLIYHRGNYTGQSRYGNSTRYSILQGHYECSSGQCSSIFHKLRTHVDFY